MRYINHIYSQKPFSLKEQPDPTYNCNFTYILN